MEAFAKVDQGIVAILAIDFGKRFYDIREVVKSPAIANVVQNGIREIEAIVATTHGIVLPFSTSPTAVWERNGSGARNAADAARAMINAANRRQNDALPDAETLPLLRIGAAYGQSLFQRDAKGRIANVLGKLLETSQSLCRKARHSNVTMLATDEFVLASGSKGFEPLENGVQALK